MTPNLITRIRIEKLFGLYTYDLPKKPSSLTNAAILYGDNGVGKSTLLRLVYHLLSAGNSRGHRTALYNAEFQSLEVTLSNGLILRAQPKPGENTKILQLEIRKKGKTIATWDYLPRRQPEGTEWVVTARGEMLHRETRRARGREHPTTRGGVDYLEALQEHAPNMFILNADRRLDSDTVSDPSDEMEIRRLMHYDTPRTINELVVRSREIGLTQALSAAAKWISRKAIMGTNQGSMNVHSVYIDVVKHLLSPYTSNDEVSSAVPVSELVRKLETIEKRMSQHANYELATELSTREFRDALKASDSEKGRLAAELLQTYIKSLDRRLEAVEPIYQNIDDFVTTLNEFLNDKSITFKLSRGFSILSSFDQSLEASQLSSGEQQLLLLFCYVLTARDQPSVFMIDEPEISLNIKWQRQLVQALLDITKGSEIQFIFASHSMELLAQHRDRVVKLENIK